MEITIETTPNHHGFFSNRRLVGKLWQLSTALGVIGLYDTLEDALFVAYDRQQGHLMMADYED